MKKIIMFSKMILVFFISLTLIFSSQISLVVAANNIDINVINHKYDISIDPSSEIYLYDKDDNVIAIFYNLEDTGYVIIDSKTSEVIEFSTENNNLFIKDSNEKYYYGGALNYFVETNDKNVILKIDSNELVDKDVAILHKSKNLNITRSLNTLPLNVTFKTAYTPRLYDTNRTGICGSTVAAIILAYYYDHVSPVYVPSNLITSDGVALTNYMIPYIDGSSPGSNYNDMVMV